MHVSKSLIDMFYRNIVAKMKYHSILVISLIGVIQIRVNMADRVSKRRLISFAIVQTLITEAQFAMQVFLFL